MLQSINANKKLKMKIQQETIFFDSDKEIQETYIEEIEVKANSLSMLLHCLTSITSDACGEIHGILHSENYEDSDGGFYRHEYKLSSYVLTEQEQSAWRALIAANTH